MSVHTSNEPACLFLRELLGYLPIITIKSPGNLMDPIASDLARANMIEQQIRPCEVLDDRVLDAMNSIPREEFVAAEYVDLFQ